jgi:hypothetical protein
MILLRQVCGNQHLHRKPNTYRDAVRQKMAAYHRKVYTAKFAEPYWRVNNGGERLRQSAGRVFSTPWAVLIMGKIAAIALPITATCNWGSSHRNYSRSSRPRFHRVSGVPSAPGSGPFAPDRPPPNRVPPWSFKIRFRKFLPMPRIPLNLDEIPARSHRRLKGRGNATCRMTPPRHKPVLSRTSVDTNINVGG